MMRGCIIAYQASVQHIRQYYRHFCVRHELKYILANRVDIIIYNSTLIFFYNKAFIYYMSFVQAFNLNESHQTIHYALN